MKNRQLSVRRVFVAGLAFLSLGAVLLLQEASAEETAKGDFPVLQRHFLEMPMEARRLTGPLYWLHGTESPDRLESYLGKVAEGGNGCFCAESRPHNDWLGPRWYKDLEICLNAAKKLDLKMWIFDERWWPSQTLGGKVPVEYRAKRLVAEPAEVEGPAKFAADGYGGKHFVAAVAGRTTPEGVDGASLVDLGPFIREGKLAWQAPKGKWQVMKFTWIVAPKAKQGGNFTVDGASRDCVDWFLDTVYQPHYDLFKDEHGKTIVGYFYDEPETQGDWGTEVHGIFEERKVDWKKALVAYKFKLAGDDQAAGRYAYYDALFEAWGRTMYGGMSKWCEDRKTVSIGHFMEHNGLYLDHGLGAGNLFQMQKYGAMGGMDLVCRQIYPGQRRSLYQMPKLTSSISHVYDKADHLAMCEIYGAYYQDLTYEQMKWLVDQHQVRGVNFMISHSFNPKSPYDRDCPPYFYNSGFEPRWPLYRVWADYTNRLSLMLAGGRHVCPVALLFCGNSKHVGRVVTPEDMTSALQDALFDCDWLPYDVFEKDCRIAGKEVCLHDERYKILVVPPVEVIPAAALEKARAFMEAGGVVIGYGFLPEKSATLGCDSARIAALRKAIWGGDPRPGTGACRTTGAGGRSFFLPEKPTRQQIAEVLTAGAGIRPTLEVLEGETDGWLHVLHRVKAGRDVFLVCNQNHEGNARQFKLRISAAGHPECWDAMRNEIEAIRFERIDTKTVEVDLSLEPTESVMLVFRERDASRPLRIVQGMEPAIDPVAIARVQSPRPAANPVPDKSLAGPRGRNLTLSPISADPFVGRCVLPKNLDLDRYRAYLEMEELPRSAAAVEVNGKPAGGVIGRPWRLNVTALLKAGENSIRIAPLAPKSAKLIFYDK